jgi:iron complex outermembrane recepter protein
MMLPGSQARFTHLLVPIFFLLFSFPHPSLHAQEEPDTATISGQVLEGESDEPFESVQVEVRDAETGEPIAGGPTDSQGRFVLRGIPPGTYELVASFIGYSDEQVEGIEIQSEGDEVEVEPIRLSVEAVVVDGVDVEADRPDVTFDTDRNIYRMDGMPAVGGGAATDALANVPELDVGIDGSVSFEGNTPEIYLNGRPAPLEDEALTAFLEQFPADMIERVEVIANPSARYDAEGSGGIVNIVLKEGTEIGLTGNVFANLGTRGDRGAGGRANFQRDDLTLQAGAFLRHRDRETRSTDLRQSLLADPSFFLEEERNSDRGDLSAGVDVSAEYDPTDRVRLWATARVNDQDRETEGAAFNRRLDLDRDLLEESERVSFSERDRTAMDARLGGRLELEAEDDAEHEWSGEFRWNSRSGDTFSLVETLELSLDDEVGEPLLGRSLEDRTREDRTRFTGRTDYTRPVGEDTQLDMGLRSQFRDRESDQFRQVGSAAGTDEELDTGYRYTRSFHSGYLTMARSFGDLGAQMGVRAELTETRFELPDGRAFENDYASVFPTVNLSWRVDDARQIRASYGQRIRRPWPGRLNPIDRSTDALTREVGNPDLEPQYTHQARLEGRWSGDMGTLSFTPFLRYTTNEWADIRRVDAEGIATETYENLASTRQMGASLTASVRDVAGIQGRVRISGRQEVRDGGPVELDAGSGSFRWSVRGNASSEITSALAAQARVSYRPTRQIPQGLVSSRVMTQVGVRQQIMDGRGSVNLLVRDPFDLYDTSFESRDSSHVQIGSSDVSRRSAVLSVSYTLGSPGDR